MLPAYLSSHYEIPTLSPPSETLTPRETKPPKTTSPITIYSKVTLPLLLFLTLYGMHVDKGDAQILF